MALEKTIINDKVEITGTYKAIGIREATIITDDGTEISRKFSRKVLQPCEKDIDGNWIDTDVSGESSDVQAIANALWTTTLKTNYKAYIDNLEE